LFASMRLALLVIVAPLACNAPVPERAAMPRAIERSATITSPPPAPQYAAAEPAPVAEVPVVSVAPDVRVATYNILAGNHGVPAVVDALRSLDADIVALQEVDRDTRRSGRIDQPTVIAEALGMEMAFAHHRSYDGGKIGVALLSRYALANVRRIVLPTGGLAVLDAEVALADDVIRVLVVHFHPTDPRDAASRRAKMDAARLREARTVLDLATRRPGATIVMGDFNARPQGPEYAAFSASLQDGCPDGFATWPATWPLVRIDYVWTSSELRSVACPRLPASASDHQPVVVDLIRAPT
jgi:endonuclease/exonuclease/phosphatase family metal-dependent hydrolase